MLKLQAYMRAIATTYKSAVEVFTNERLINGIKNIHNFHYACNIYNVHAKLFPSFLP